MKNRIIYKEDGTLWWAEKYNNACKLDKPVGNGSVYLSFALDKKRRYVHRFIWEMFNGPIPEGMEIDHIDGDSKNNRIENLRLATSSQNKCNKSKGTNNTSGFKGVSFHKASGRWRAGVTLKRVTKHLGYFDTPEEANSAYQKHAPKLHGEFTFTS